MIRVYAFNILYDINDFLKKNYGKFIIALIVLIAGAVLGIRNALNVTDAGSYLIMHSSTTFLLILGEKGVGSYFFIKLIILLGISLLIILLSFNFYLSLLNFVFTFFYTYIFMLYMTLYIILFKATVLPFVIVCLIPCFLMAYFMLSVFIIKSINRAKDIQCYGCYNSLTFINHIRAMIPLLVALLIIVILETLLAFLTTLGIVI